MRTSLPPLSGAGSTASINRASLICGSCLTGWKLPLRSAAPSSTCSRPDRNAAPAPSTIRRWEHGKHQPCLFDLRKLLNGLEATAEERSAILYLLPARSECGPRSLHYPALGARQASTVPL